MKYVYAAAILAILGLSQPSYGFDVSCTDNSCTSDDLDNIVCDNNVCTSTPPG
jgi:hypothetical protein